MPHCMVPRCTNLQRRRLEFCTIDSRKTSVEKLYSSQGFRAQIRVLLSTPLCARLTSHLIVLWQTLLNSSMGTIIVED